MTPFEGGISLIVIGVILLMYILRASHTSSVVDRRRISSSSHYSVLNETRHSLRSSIKIRVPSPLGLSSVRFSRNWLLVYFCSTQ